MIPDHPPKPSLASPETVPEPAVSVSVVEAVAEAENASPTEIAPLYDAIDPDALDQLFAAESREADRAPTRVSFTYSGYEVSVDDDGEISLADVERP